MSASQQDNTEGKRKQKKGLDYTFGRELNEKLGNLLGCPKQDNINMCRFWVSSLLSQPALLHVRAAGVRCLCGHLCCSLCRCCTDQNLRRSIAVEVKSVATDEGRAKFVHLLRYMPCFLPTNLMI